MFLNLILAQIALNYSYYYLGVLNSELIFDKKKNNPNPKQGVCHTWGLAIYIKNYLKAKEELGIKKWDNRIFALLYINLICT
jgi:hypothetical protein